MSLVDDEDAVDSFVTFVISITKIDIHVGIQAYLSK